MHHIDQKPNVIYTCAGFPALLNQTEYSISSNQRGHSVLCEQKYFHILMVGICSKEVFIEYDLSLEICLKLCPDITEFGKWGL